MKQIHKIGITQMTTGLYPCCSMTDPEVIREDGLFYVRCPKCKRITSGHSKKKKAIKEWNDILLNKMIGYR